MSWLMPSQEITSLCFSCTAPTHTHYQLSLTSRPYQSETGLDIPQLAGQGCGLLFSAGPSRLKKNPKKQQPMPQLSQGFYHFVHVTHSPRYQSLKIVLCRFATLLASNKISYSSIKSDLSAIRHLHVAKGLPDPCIANMPKLERVVKGTKSQQARIKDNTARLLPITTAIMQRIQRYLEPRLSDPDMVLIWAAASICFFGFLRAGELTVLSEAAFDLPTNY